MIQGNSRYMPEGLCQYFNHTRRMKTEKRIWKKCLLSAGKVSGLSRLLPSEWEITDEDLKEFEPVPE